MPKMSVSDTGLASYLTEVEANGLEHNISTTLAGVVPGELSKQRAWSVQYLKLTHFRDDHGHGVDIILQNRRRKVVGIEVKATSDPLAMTFKDWASYAESS